MRMSSSENISKSCEYITLLSKWKFVRIIQCQNTYESTGIYWICVGWIQQNIVIVLTLWKAIAKEEEESDWTNKVTKCLNVVWHVHTFKWHGVESVRKLDNKNTAAFIGINHFPHRLHWKMGPNASSTAQAGTTLQRWKSSKHIAPPSHWQVNWVYFWYIKSTCIAQSGRYILL